ncbi:hypothetical protein PIB30_064683 [Stylosanthes scabra]|uniref:RING-type domain-containing protein n=1 Tax=Stylosanthes scabra TaxID=79078 RepID=A0ABU6VK84_9FABA|nr:hypothetical protein [Stylosanthes scabra]
MSRVLSPVPVSPPPPSSSSSSPISNKNIMPMFNYGLVVVGTAVIVLVIYNLLIIKHCHRRRDMSDQFPTRNSNNRFIEVVVTAANSGEGIRSFENNNYYAAAASKQRNSHLLSSFKYKKEKMTSSSTSKEGSFSFVDDASGGGDSDECAVCLSVFEEGEEVRKLPRCKHSFHALCIDMWLYSHFDCPVCRTPVGPFCNPFPATENSRSGGSGGGSGISA